MKAVIARSEVRGSVPAVPSKSHAHRLLIAAALSPAPCKLVCPVTSRDIDATVRCLNALGARIERTADGFDITPVDRENLPLSPTLDCGESGSTLRFLLPVACALGVKARFVGEGRLPSRPLGGLADCLTDGGAELTSDRLPLTTGGRLAGGEFRVRADVSSQYVSGMLFALAALRRPVRLVTEGDEVSAGYTEMTLSVLRLFGCDAVRTPSCYRIDGRAMRAPARVKAEGDWSGAAFMLAAGALCGDVTVTGLDPTSTQRDRAIADILRGMGATVTEGTDFCRATASPLHGLGVDITDTPDLAPVLSVLMAAASGKSVMKGVLRLRDKESDRLAGICDNLAAVGVQTVLSGDCLAVYGGGLHPFAAKGMGDHRMVMSAAVAALACSGEVTDAEAIGKSYPAFFDDLKTLGGNVNESL